MCLPSDGTKCRGIRLPRGITALETGVIDPYSRRKDKRRKLGGLDNATRLDNGGRSR